MTISFASTRLAYNIDESAELLGCSRAHIFRLMESGALRSVKLGRLRRIPAEALAELLAGDADATAS